MQKKYFGKINRKINESLLKWASIFKKEIKNIVIEIKKLKKKHQCQQLNTPFRKTLNHMQKNHRTPQIRSLVKKNKNFQNIN